MVASSPPADALRRVRSVVPSSGKFPPNRPSLVAYNLRRLMARDGLTYDDVVERTGLDARTLRGILHGQKRPHARTLNRLAQGMGVSADELFQGDEAAALAEFDAATNPAIADAIESEPELFATWTPSDFGELASRVGHGGAMTDEGVLDAARQMNADRETLARARIVLESSQAELLRGVIDALFERSQPESPRPPRRGRPPAAADLHDATPPSAPPPPAAE